MKRLKRGERLGKYRIERTLGSGGFGTVYRARDTIEDTRVALKVIPAGGGAALREDLLREVRLLARLDHPNILRLKNADVVGNAVLMAYPLGETTLADRLRRRLGPTRALGIAEQVLDAVAHAHQRRIIHCDIKPDNVILFADDHVSLADFGIARVALKTRPLSASGAGTLGYLAPEQALGRPSFRSDVFALGILIHELLTGYIPDWPFRWPPPGHDRLRRAAHPALIDVIRRALLLDERKRFRDARAMRTAFRAAGRKRKPRASARRDRPEGAAWEAARVREFQRSFGKGLATRASCAKCDHPVSEQMAFCPWCGVAQRRFRSRVAYRSRCRRCGRGVRADWRYCAFCFGAQVQEPAPTTYRPPAGARACPSCRTPVPALARYCPTCRRKVRPWLVPGSVDKCPRCRWGVVTRFWRFCPWCARGLPKGKRDRSPSVRR